MNKKEEKLTEVSKSFDDLQSLANLDSRTKDLFKLLLDRNVVSDIERSFKLMEDLKDRELCLFLFLTKVKACFIKQALTFVKNKNKHKNKIQASSQIKKGSLFYLRRGLDFVFMEGDTYAFVNYKSFDSLFEKLISNYLDKKCSKRLELEKSILKILEKYMDEKIDKLMNNRRRFEEKKYVDLNDMGENIIELKKKERKVKVKFEKYQEIKFKSIKINNELGDGKNGYLHFNDNFGYDLLKDKKHKKLSKYDLGFYSRRVDICNFDNEKCFIDYMKFKFKYYADYYLDLGMELKKENKEDKTIWDVLKAKLEKKIKNKILNGDLLLLEEDKMLLEEEKELLEEEKELLEERKLLLEENKMLSEEDKSLLEEEKMLLEERKMLLEYRKSLLEEEKELFEEENLFFEEENLFFEEGQIDPLGLEMKEELIFLRKIEKQNKNYPEEIKETIERERRKMVKIRDYVNDLDGKDLTTMTHKFDLLYKYMNDRIAEMFVFYVENKIERYVHSHLDLVFKKVKK